MNGAAFGNQAVYNFFEEATDDLSLALGVVTSHKRPDKAFGAHSAQAVAVVDEQHFEPFAGCCHSCAYAGGSASDYQQVGLV